jgi:hypothetical protein
MLWLNIEDNHPARTCQIAGPIVMSNDNLVILGHATSRNKCAAVARRLQLRILRRLLLFRQPRQVIIRYFFERVQGDDVPHIEIYTLRLDAVSNPLQFLLILGIDMRPEHVPRRIAKELPISSGLVGIKELDGLKRVGNLGSQ